MSAEELISAEVAEEAYSDEETVAQLTKVLKRRMSTLALIARMFRTEVDQTFLDELKGMRFPSAAQNEAINTGYGLIVKYLNGVWENTLTELAVDYVRVFIGYGMDSFSAAFPYESVYTSERRLLMQDARDEVLALYRAAGLEKDDRWQENEDHIAVELEFLEVLTRRAIEALEAGDEDEAFRLLLCQYNFMTDHLCSWAPMMTEDMRKFAKTDFYRGLSYLTEGFLADDREFLNDLLGVGDQEEASV